MTQKITTNEVREKYLNHFKKYGHTIIPSSRLIPENDPTTLFTGSGMQPMVPYLLGQKHPLGTRIADSQKCFRSQDIEEVGDNRHTTFFEMLGNWSLGDYFKEEQISWMWEFLIEELKLDPTRLYFTCFIGDESLGVPRDTFAAEKWQSLFKGVGIDAGIGEDPENDGIVGDQRIFYYVAKKNWWSRAGVPANMPVGEPGGPDTEMFYDFEPNESERVLHSQSSFKDTPCHVNCDCGRFMEIGNNVFMEYVKTETGFEKLGAPNVDFGAGLERMAAAVNNDSDMFKIDVFAKVIETIEKLSGVKYEPKSDSTQILGADKLTQSIRVVLDHMRAVTFLIGDDVLPGNKDQNYFVRRLLRRAVRNGKNLGIKENFCKDIADTYIDIYKEHYTNLSENREKILQAIDDEEAKFRKNIDIGEKKLLKIINLKLDTDNAKVIVPDQIITAQELFDLYQNDGFPVELSLEILRELDTKINNGMITRFMDNFRDFEQRIIHDFNHLKDAHSQQSRAGSEQKFKGGLADNSEIVVKYHTATHLLHQALKNVLGESANQKGSNITAERLRFDFSFDRKMTVEEIAQTEKLVNEWVQNDMIVRREEMPKTEAEERNPIHLFGEKYGDVVSIYTIAKDENGKVRGVDATSVEFCGGPHVEHTAQIGEGGKVFKITKEEAVSAGVRRIKAVLL